jgi:hypothetical protein
MSMQCGALLWLWLCAHLCQVHQALHQLQTPLLDIVQQALALNHINGGLDGSHAEGGAAICTALQAARSSQIVLRHGTQNIALKFDENCSFHQVRQAFHADKKQIQHLAYAAEHTWPMLQNRAGYVQGLGVNISWPYRNPKHFEDTACSARGETSLLRRSFNHSLVATRCQGSSSRLSMVSSQPHPKSY